MAGVDPQQGLYSAILGMTVYAIFATSRHLKITTSSTMSIAVVAPLVASGFGTYVALSSTLAITVGIIMLILAFMKLGFISDLLSKSVMTGYILGVALLIAMSQLPKVLGGPGGSGIFFQQLGQLIANLPQTNPYALALGAGTIVLILLIKRFKPLIPGAAGVDSGNDYRRIFSAQREVQRRRRRGHPDRDAESDAPDHQPASDSVSHWRRVL
jgi:sulfate permease, SulP family